MTRSSYRERDYAFGERMVTLRSAIGLTQTGLAQLLGVSRRAVSRWETGETYPYVYHLAADDAPSIELFASEVAPATRELFAARRARR